MSRVTDALSQFKARKPGDPAPMLDVSRGGPPGWSPDQYIPMKQTPVEAGSLKEFPNIRTAIIVVVRDNTILLRKFTSAQMFTHVRQMLSDSYTVSQLELMEDYLKSLGDDEFVQFCLSDQKLYDADDAQNTQVMLQYLVHHLEMTL